jgi:rod shape-determining protein MreD
LSVPVLLVAAILQSTLFKQLNFYGAVPNLVLIIVVAWGLLRGGRESYLWAFVGGLALDLLSGGPLGLSSLALLLIAALISLTEGHVHSHATLLALAAAALGTLAFDTVLILGLALGGRQPWVPAGVEPLARQTLTAMAVNTLLMLPTHRILRRLYRAAEQSEVRLGF